MATLQRKLRVGIAGIGRIYPLHLRGYRGNEDAEIVGLFEPDAQRCAEEAQNLSGVVACSSFEALLDLELDLVEILSPHPLHAEQAVTALRRGVNVSVQKPMAMSLEEADSMIEAAQAAGRRLRVYENFRFLPAIEKAKQLLDSGAIGRPLHCRMRTLAGDPVHAWAVRGETWRWRAEIFEKRQLGRLTYDDGHHKMATALWLFGPVGDVFAFIDHRESPYGRIDAPASVSWRHRDTGVHVVWDVIHAPQLRIRTDYYSLDECIEVTGEHGIIKITRATGRMIDEPVLTVYRDGEVRAFHNIETDWGASFEACTRALLVGMRTGGEVPLSGLEGRQVMELAIAIAEAAATGRAVEIPPTQQSGSRA